FAWCKVDGARICERPAKVGKPFFNVVVVVAERVVVESGWQVCRIHFTGKLVKVCQTLVEHEQFFAAMLLCNLLCKAHLFDQRIDVASPLLVCPKYGAIVNNERLVMSELRSEERRVGKEGR